MSTQSETIEQRAMREASVKLRWAVDEVKALQKAERILISVERSLLGSALEAYGTDGVNEAMRALNQKLRDEDAVSIGEAQATLTDELYAWRMVIFRRDEKIMAHSLRRFCERTDGSLDLHAFAALARFYRRCPHVGSVQCKYDLAVTRLFTIADGNHRSLRASREQLTNYLTKMCAAWDESERTEMAAQQEEEIARTVQEFDAFIDEVNAIKHFEDLIASDLFSRIRTFKSEIGELFYDPQVTAAAIECNVIAGNKFSSLMEAESDHIGDEPEASRELRDVFCDTSPGALDRIAQVLDELQADDGHEDEVARKRLERAVRILNIACASSGGELSGGEVGESETGADAALEERHTSPETLDELAQVDDNKELVEAYLEAGRTAEVRALDLAVFLASAAEDNDDGQDVQADTRRRALSLIMRADDMLRLEVVAAQALNSDFETRLARLFEEMQAVEGALREMMSTATSHDARRDALLYVSNHLLGARLRLQSAIVRRSSAELARQEAARQAARVPKAISPKRLFSLLPDRQRAQKLAVAALIIIALATLASTLLRRNSSRGERDPEVRVLNRNEVPGGEMLADIRMRRELLIGVVRNTWKHLPEDVKKQELESLLRYGKDKGIRIVALFDEQGMPTGNATEGQITIENNMKPPQQ